VRSALIQLCGRFVVELEGERIEAALPGRQGRLLFAYLVLNRGRAVPRSELTDAVWAADLPREPADALAALLSKVRSALGNRYLEGRSELVLVLPGDAAVDVESALAAVHEAESACSLKDWHRAWRAGIAAELVTRRTLLPDLEAPWIDEWRRSLEGVRLRALESYGRACLALGGTELAAAERAARELIRVSPLRESAYVLLMEALEAQGNVADALVVYESIRTRLREELGTSPAEPLRAVHARLLQTGEPDADSTGMPARVQSRNEPS
jgi:DNA-binding SARP family transcriptional activator